MILDASLEVRGAIVYATLIEIVAILPIFMLAGLSGAFFQPLAIAYALALLASHGRRADGHPGAQPDPLPQRQVSRAPGVAARPAGSSAATSGSSPGS